MRKRDSPSSLRPAGIRICERWRRPPCSLPGKRRFPPLGRPKVTVSSALTALPSIAPVRPLTPEGISRLTTGRGSELIVSMVSSNVPSTGTVQAGPQKGIDQKGERLRTVSRQPIAAVKGKPHLTAPGQMMSPQSPFGRLPRRQPYFRAMPEKRRQGQGRLPRYCLSRIQSVQERRYGDIFFL